MIDNSANSIRENSDFVFYNGHGLRHSLFLGNGWAYGTLHVAAWDCISYGKGNVRWIWYNSCLTMRNSSTIISLLGGTLGNGAHVLVGYNSVGYSWSNSLPFFNSFWYRWTHHQSLKRSYFDALHYDFYNGSGVPGLSPAVYTQVLNTGGDWSTWERLCDRDYHNSSNQRLPSPWADYYYEIYGNPIWQ